MSIASGTRSAGSTTRASCVKLDARCAAEAPSLRFAVGDADRRASSRSSPTAARRSCSSAWGASRGTSSRSPRSAATRTPRSSASPARDLRAAPQPRATLELDERRRRSTSSRRTAAAIVRFASAEDHARLVLLPLDGVYEVLAVAGGTAIRGVKGRRGLRRAALRLPRRLAPRRARDDRPRRHRRPGRAARSRRRTSRPPLGASAANDNEPLVELLCGDGDGGALASSSRARPRTSPSRPATRAGSSSTGSASRPEDGAQRLNLDDRRHARRRRGAPRRARLAANRAPAPGGAAALLVHQGGEGPVRPRHRPRRATTTTKRTTSGPANPADAPAAQWSVIAGRGHRAHLRDDRDPDRASTASSDRAHSGILTLNFGVDRAPHVARLGGARRLPRRRGRRHGAWGSPTT